MQSSASAPRMTGGEFRAALSLGSIFALRMLGLFLILPVFAVHAPALRGGDDLALVGLALGAYGLTQGFLQIPYGIAADRYGRKRVIMLGLLLFAAGSFVAAVGTDIWVTIIGRCMQGAGAISAAVMALAADLTREEQRTKTMAIIGSSIGLMFALSLVGAPTLYRWIGMGGIFALTGILALGAIVVLYRLVPAEPVLYDPAAADIEAPTLWQVLQDVELLRLNFGIFALHMAQMAMFVVVPPLLVEYAGLPVERHWLVYLPVVLASFVLMVPALMVSERHGRAKRIFVGAICLLVLVQLGYSLGAYSLAWQITLLLGFFVAFNILEASLPSLVSRIAPPAAKATALGVYNTTQSLGLFVGGAFGGWLAKHYGSGSVFLFGVVVLTIWAVIAGGMKVPAPRRSATTTVVSTAGPEQL